VRSLLWFLVLGACATEVPTSTTSDPLIGTPYPTGTSSATFPNTQVGNTSGVMSFQIDEDAPSTSVVETVTLTYSCADFTVTTALSGTASNACMSVTTCQPGMICTQQPVLLSCMPDVPFEFSVDFHPHVAATETCVITATGSKSSITRTVTLTGTGTAPPIHVTASPASINFGGVRTATTSTPVTVTVTNAGASAATI
jgi:hypothetical protein